MRKVLSLFFMVCICVSCIFINGCGKKSANIQKINDLSFTVVRESEIPEEVLQHIEEKKQNEFKFTFYNKDKKDYLYIIVGYGQQPTGGYSITVEDLYLTANSIYIDTSLVGPSKDDVVTQAITYPYIVVKIEYIDKPVTFL